MTTDSSVIPSRWASVILRTKQFQHRIQLQSYVLGLIASLVLGGGYWMYAGSSSQSTSTQATTTVARQTITTSVKATGKVTFASEQELRFNQKGTVAKVNVKQGDRVKQGQIIAELDKSSVLADIRQAELSAGASALQLQQLQAQKQQTILDAQNTAQNAARALEVSQQKLPSDLAAAERAVAEKQAALTQAKADLEKQKTTELQTLAQTAQSILTSSEKLLDSFYGILTQDQSARPPSGDFTIEISHVLWNDTATKNQTVNSYYDAMNRTNDMHASYGTTLTSERDPTKLLSALADAQSLAEAVQQLSENSYLLLQGATTGTSGYTVDDLQADRTAINANRTTAAGLVQSALTAQANLAATSQSGGIPSNTLQQKKDAVTTAENALTVAQDNLSVLQTQTPGDLQQQQDALQSKTAAASATTVTTNVNIQLKQNDLAQKSVSLQKARKVLQDYQLTAPFEGIVTHIDYKVGDNLLDTGDTEYVVLQNPDFVLVTIPLDQTDVVRVKTGMAAAITLDALPGQEFQGAIDAIDPTPIEQSGVVSYNVEVKLPAPANLTILSGMTSTVSIETSRKENVLVVPNLALRTQGSSQTVQKATGETVTVQTGVTDGRVTEILSGLNEGDIILSVNIATTTSQTKSTNTAQQLFRLGGGGGGGRPPGD